MVVIIIQNFPLDIRSNSFLEKYNKIIKNNYGKKELVIG